MRVIYRKSLTCHSNTNGYRACRSDIDVSFCFSINSRKMAKRVISDQYIVVLKEGIQGPPRVAEETRAKGGEVMHGYDRAVTGFAVKAQDLPTGIPRADAHLSPVRAGNGAGAVDVDVAIIDTGILTKHPDPNVYSPKSFVKG